MVDLAIINAKVWTVDPGLPTAQAVAVKGDRIAAVGTDGEVREAISPATTVIDAGGRLVLPGFNDAHVHFIGGGRSLVGVDLRGAADEEEFVERLRAHVAGLPDGEWVTGGRWDHEAWPSRRRPDRRLIDPVTPNNPVLLHRLDGHVAVANTAALRLAGVTADTADPDGGRIERDPESGEPTGILIDRAQGLVGKVVPRPDAEGELAAARAALRHAASVGVTSLQTMGSTAELRTCRRLLDAGELTARVCVTLGVDMAEPLGRLDLGPGFGGPLLCIGGVKAFVDGSLGAGSALLFEPYDDAPGTRGLAIHAEEELYDLVGEADAAGLQVVVHAIGDRATHLALNAFEHAVARNGRRQARHRVEHAQVCRPEDRGRFGELGVIASIQPSHCTDDMRWVERRLGERTQFAYPFRSLLDAGAQVAVGTDWPVEPLDPLLTIHAAVTREFPAGGPPGGWHPAERVSGADAVRAYTLGSAHAEFQDHVKGSITPGKLADMVILSADIFAVPPQGIVGARVDVTIIGGQIIHERATGS